jgi:hypothetical protein
MEIEQNWATIRNVVQNAMKTSHHVSFATVSADGVPHVTPIGSLMLRDDCTGYYFEEFSNTMPANFEDNQRISILAVNSGMWYWLKSIRSGRFSSLPGVRLHGRVGDRRPARVPEIDDWRERIKKARNTKGYKLIWENLAHVRDIEFDSYEPITAGVMTKHLVMS